MGWGGGEGGGATHGNGRTRTTAHVAKRSGAGRSGPGRASGVLTGRLTGGLTEQRRVRPGLTRKGSRPPANNKHIAPCGALHELIATAGTAAHVAKRGLTSGAPGPGWNERFADWLADCAGKYITPCDALRPASTAARGVRGMRAACSCARLYNPFGTWRSRVAAGCPVWRRGTHIPPDKRSALWLSLISSRMRGLVARPSRGPFVYAALPPFGQHRGTTKGSAPRAWRCGRRPCPNHAARSTRPSPSAAVALARASILRAPHYHWMGSNPQGGRGWLLSHTRYLTDGSARSHLRVANAVGELAHSCDVDAGTGADV